jgi:hypothetical protein
LVWILGVTAVLFQIIVFVAKANIDTLQAVPRSVDHAPALQPHAKLSSPPISVIAFGNSEPVAYASEIISGLTKAGFIVKPLMHVSSRPDAPSGLTVIMNGHDGTQLLLSLDQAGIKYATGQQLHVPLSAIQSVADSIVLEIGAK